MKKWLFLISLSSVFCLAQKVSNEESHIQKIDSLGTRYLKLERFSGVIVIIKHESLIYYKDFGLADYATQKSFQRSNTFNIGEISELVTKKIISQFIKDEKIKVNQKINKYLPKLRVEFTIKDLLEHKTYLPDLSSLDKSLLKKKGTLEKLVNSISSIENYSSKGGDLEYTILNKLIEKISKKDYSEVVDNFARKMKMDNTFSGNLKLSEVIGYQYHNYRNKGLELHPIPLSNKKFDKYHIKSSAIDVAKLLSKFTDEKIVKNGYIDGFSYAVENSFKKNISIVILSNRQHPVGQEMITNIKAILSNTKYHLPLLRKEVDINIDFLKDYVGKYKLDNGVQFRIVKKEDNLYALLGGNEVRLYPQSANQFYMKNNDAAIKFERGNGSKKVNQAILLDGFIKGIIAKKLD